MHVFLGPMPTQLREVVRTWVKEHHWADPATDPHADATTISGGPSWCTLLKENGDVFRWNIWDETITIVEDGPGKIVEIVIGAKHRPELLSWLPIRPPQANTCAICNGEGWIAHWSKVVCHDCSGLGWTGKEVMG